METDKVRPFDADAEAHALELFDLPLSQLISLARAASDAAVARGASHVGASPVILTGNCTTRPICRHCKWNHFKAIKKNAFILDTTEEQVRQRMHTLVANGIARAFTATGWLGYRLPERFVHMVQVAHEAEPGIELYGLFGALDKQSHLALAQAGMTGMLTGLESPSEAVYRSFRPGGDSQADRIASYAYVRESGMKLWTGFLVGLGETSADVAHGIGLIAPWEPESVSVLPFEPYPDTEMADCPPCDVEWLARCVAVARICLPDVAHFFTDHAGAFRETYAEALGLNGSYETGVR